MRKIFLVGILFLALSLVSCANGPWRMVEGVRSWTDTNYASMEKRQQDAGCAELISGKWVKGPQYDSDECVFMRKYIIPYMNILKHALAAVEAIRIGDDIMLASECYIITKIAANLGVSYSAMTSALLNKDMEKASAQIDGLEAFIVANSGVAIEPPEKKGWIRRTWEKIW